MRAPLARYGLLVPLIGGAVLLAVAEFLPLYEVRAITAVIAEGNAGPNHSYALLVIAVALVPMSLGAVLGGSRPAAFATLAFALVAVGVTLLNDLPDVRETGLTRSYEAAAAHPKLGFYLQTLGSALALVGAVGALVLHPDRLRATRTRGRATATS